MSDWSGYDTRDTPQSIRDRRMWEIEQGAKRGSLSGLLDRIRGHPGGGGSDSGGGGESVIDTLKRVPEAVGQIREGIGERRDERQAERQERDERRERNREYASEEIRTPSGEMKPRGQAGQGPRLMEVLQGTPSDTWDAINEYVDANPQTTRPLQEAAYNGDWNKFYEEFESLRRALGLAP